MQAYSASLHSPHFARSTLNFSVTALALELDLICTTVGTSSPLGSATLGLKPSPDFDNVSVVGDMRSPAVTVTTCAAGRTGFPAWSRKVICTLRSGLT